MLKKDGDGKYPLSMPEYAALRQIFGTVNALDDSTLKARCKLIPYGWRDMRLMLALTRKLMANLLDTIPNAKRQALMRELDYTICLTTIKPPAMPTNDCAFVSQKAMIRMIDRAMEMNCPFCDKSLKEAKRCQLYKDICACFPYELHFETDKDCPLSGYAHMEEIEND